MNNEECKRFNDNKNDEENQLLIKAKTDNQTITDESNEHETEKSIDTYNKIVLIQTGKHFNFDEDSKMPVIDQIHSYVGYGRVQFLQFFVSGFIFFSEGFFLTMIPSVIIPMKEYFKINDLVICIINMMMFIFLAIGNLLGSHLSGNLTRKNLFLVALLFKIPCSILILLSRSLEVFTASFVIIGLSLGLIVPVAMNNLTEIIPIYMRAFTITFVWCFFCLAQFLTPLLLSTFMPTLNHENLFTVISIGIIFSNVFMILSFILFQESPRHLLFEGKSDEAFSLLEKMMKLKLNEKTKEKLIKETNLIISETEKKISSNNNSNNIEEDINICNIDKLIDINDHEKKNNELFPHTIINIENNENDHFINAGDKQDLKKASKNFSFDSNLKKLFSEKYKNITVITASLWFINSMIFYGPSLILTVTIEKLSRYYNLRQETNEMNIAKNANSDVVNSLYYYALAALISLTFSAFISEIKYFGRRGSIIVTYFFGFVSGSFMIIIPNKFIVFYLGMSFFTTIGYNIMGSYTSELYSTDIRDSALGFFFFVNRVGALISQILFLQFFKMSLNIPYIILFLLSLLASLLSCSYPYDTLGRSLDSVSTVTKK